MIGQEVVIVKTLLNNKAGEMNVNRLARLARKQYKTTHTIVKRLEKQGVVRTSSFGMALKVELLPGLHPLVFQAEHERRQELLKNKNLTVMLDNFTRGLKSRFFVLLLFGSHVKKTAAKHSDIDVLFIVPDKEEHQAEQEINRIASTMPLPLHINIFSETAFVDMKNSKVKTVVSEAIDNNVILHGIETYYGLIQ